MVSGFCFLSLSPTPIPGQEKTASSKHKAEAPREQEEPTSCDSLQPAEVDLPADDPKDEAVAGRESVAGQRPGRGQESLLRSVAAVSVGKSAGEKQHFLFFRASPRSQRELNNLKQVWLLPHPWQVENDVGACSTVTLTRPRLPISRCPASEWAVLSGPP